MLRRSLMLLAAARQEGGACPWGYFQLQDRIPPRSADWVSVCLVIKTQQDTGL